MSNQQSAVSCFLSCLHSKAHVLNARLALSGSRATHRLFLLLLLLHRTARITVDNPKAQQGQGLGFNPAKP